jgi:hypothetical protein
VPSDGVSDAGITQKHMINRIAAANTRFIGHPLGQMEYHLKHQI